MQKRDFLAKFLLTILFFSSLNLLLLSFSAKKTLAQGTFDCRWGSTAPGNPPSCHTANHNCDPGYYVDFDHCGQLTPQGEEACEAGNQNVACVGESGGACVGASTGQPGVCYTTTLCPANTVQDGTCAEGGRCCIQAGAGAYLCDSGEGIDTAIGCMTFTNITSFTQLMLMWFIGIGGGISFLLMVFATFTIMTSAGDPQKLAGGRTLLTSAIAGLLLMVFSVFMLEIIGVDILRIPDF